MWEREQNGFKSPGGFLAHQVSLAYCFNYKRSKVSVILRSQKLLPQFMLQVNAFIDIHGEPRWVRAQTSWRRRKVTGEEIGHIAKIAKSLITY